MRHSGTAHNRYHCRIQRVRYEGASKQNEQGYGSGHRRRRLHRQPRRAAAARPRRARAWCSTTSRTGFRQAVGDTPLVVGDVGDRDLVGRAARASIRCGTVMHFAANTIVPESVRDPLKYYGNNTCPTRNLLEACMQGGVQQFVFSSTAAVYGIPAAGLAREDMHAGADQSLRHLEADVRVDAARPRRGHRFPLRQPALLQRRRLRSAGPHRPVHRQGHAADQGGLRGRWSASARTCRIFGTDYPTPDGTGVRDYIHVEDLARAHLHALDYLRGGGAATILNCGYGHGYSVREVLRQRGARQRQAAHHPRRAAPRRRSAQPGRARRPHPRACSAGSRELDDLDAIVRSALRWEEKLLREPW